MNDLRVGIPIIGGKGWLGGVSHMELHVKAVTSLPKSERPQLYLIVDPDSLLRLDCYQRFIDLFDGIIYVGKRTEKLASALGASTIYCRTYDELFKVIDFYFPVNFNVWEGRCAASWIHDFQHKYLTNFFSNHDIMLRDHLCEKVALRSRLVFCSSKAVERDFWKFYPHSPAITRVLALRVFPEEEWYRGDPVAVQKQYDLPDEFVICCNQFWMHKNHLLFFKAIEMLRNAGKDVHVVCTGGTGDFRCSGYFKTVKDYIAQLGIQDLVHILGIIPRNDQIQLLRRSMFAVQPSLFEGLSLIVQECRALGKPIILSDLEVHREHEYGVYFNRYSPEDLVSKMQILLGITKTGPDVQREAEARILGTELAQLYGRQFCKLVEDAQMIFGRKVPAGAIPSTTIKSPIDIKRYH